MKTRALILSLIFLAFACKAKDSVEEDLKNTMQAYLYKEIKNDSSNVKYRVQDVIFYDDKERSLYVCEFTVNLKEKLFDTTGKMKANISKDFQEVKRIY